MSDIKLGELERIALVRHLYALGVSQSRQPEPHCAAGLLTLHDAVELLLQVAAEHAGIPTAVRIAFMDYWKAFSRAGYNLPSAGMQRLNAARVGLKHHAVLPRRVDLVEFGSLVLTFMEAVMTAVFASPLASVSLATLLPEGEASKELKAAEEDLSTGDYESALRRCAVSMDVLVKAYEDSKRGRWSESPFLPGKRSIHAFVRSPTSRLLKKHFRTRMRCRDLDFVDVFGDWARLEGQKRQFQFRRSGMGQVFQQPARLTLGRRWDDDERDLREFLQKEFRELWKELEGLQAPLRIVMLGFDYRKWARFVSLTPSVHYSVDGHRHVLQRRAPTECEIMREDVEFCVGFVVETALRFREFDYSALDAERG